MRFNMKRNRDWLLLFYLPHMMVGIISLLLSEVGLSLRIQSQKMRYKGQGVGAGFAGEKENRNLQIGMWQL